MTVSRCSTQVTKKLMNNYHIGIANNADQRYKLSNEVSEGNKVSLLKFERILNVMIHGGGVDSKMLN